MKFSTGSEFGHRYTLGDRIAVGGMGEVWRATDGVLGRPVAIKLLSPSLAEQPGFTQRFREEARNTAALSHGNIAAVYDYGEDAGASWLVMELVEGRPLSQIIKEEGPIDAAYTSSIVAQAASALQAAHDAGVIHRDVKPANILVRRDGFVKLTDFGIARAIDAAPITRTGEVMGTAQYISPEQAMGRQVGPASDIYGLGVVAHEMLTGERPFDEGSPVATAMAHIHNPPPPLPAATPDPPAGVIMACLAKDPSLRPRSARDVADALTGRAGAPVYGRTERLHDMPPTGPTAVYPAPGPTTGSTNALRLGADAAEEAPRRNPLLWLIPLLLVLAAAAFAVSQFVPRGTAPPSVPAPTTIITTPATPTSSETTSSSTRSTVQTVEINRSDYVGRSYGAVSSELSQLGLEPRQQKVDSDAPAGQVVDVAPTGTLEKGSTVRVYVSRGPQTPTPTTTSSTPTPTSPTPTPTQDTPDPTPTSDSPPATDPTTGSGTGNAGNNGNPAGSDVPDRVGSTGGNATPGAKADTASRAGGTS